MLRRYTLAWFFLLTVLLVDSDAPSVNSEVLLDALGGVSEIMEIYQRRTIASLPHVLSMEHVSLAGPAAAIL